MTCQTGLKFLEENKLKPGVVALPSGLQYKVLEKGSGGFHPTVNSPCLCHYAGTLIDGTGITANLIPLSIGCCLPSKAVLLLLFFFFLKLCSFCCSSFYRNETQSLTPATPEDPRPRLHRIRWSRGGPKPCSWWWKETNSSFTSLLSWPTVIRAQGPKFLVRRCSRIFVFRCLQGILLLRLFC